MVSAAPALADDPIDTQEQALTEFRANLVTQSDTAGLATFDALDEEQRSELATYLLGESVSFDAPPDGAEQDGTGVYTYGDFQWAAPGGGGAAARSTDIPVWGTASFSFAGISIIEVKNSMTYTVAFSPSRGNYISAIPSYSCKVTHNYDIFAEVTSTKENAFADGDWEVESQCDVKVKRGAPTPWGQITWSTKEATHYVRADNTGWVMANGFK